MKSFLLKNYVFFKLLVEKLKILNLCINKVKIWLDIAYRSDKSTGFLSSNNSNRILKFEISSKYWTSKWVFEMIMVNYVHEF